VIISIYFPDEKESIAKAVTVTFERMENERSKAAREKGFHHMQGIIADEPWIEMEYHG